MTRAEGANLRARLVVTTTRTMFLTEGLSRLSGGEGERRRRGSAAMGRAADLGGEAATLEAFERLVDLGPGNTGLPGHAGGHGSPEGQEGGVGTGFVFGQPERLQVDHGAHRCSAYGMRGAGQAQAAGR